MLNGILKRKDRDGEVGVTVKEEEPRMKLPSANGKRLLAGYFAHEFLTRGTLLGKPWGGSSAMAVATPEMVYNDVSNVLMMMRDGGHLGDVVNPTQLSSWLET